MINPILSSPMPPQYVLPAELVTRWCKYTRRCQTPGEGGELLDLMADVGAHLTAQEEAWTAKREAVKRADKPEAKPIPPAPGKGQDVGTG